MRSAGTYQLVSEHSILSAQMKNKVAAVEEILEKQALHSKPEWKEELDKIKRHLQLRTKDDGGRRSRRDHASCDELSEKEFQIYLEMKLEWIQQFYVAANSSKPEQKTREPEEDGWNEPDFKVYDRGREELEEANSRRRRSREDEFYDKLEEMAEILGRYLSNVAVKSSKPEERRETEELKREKDEIEGSGGVPWNVNANPKGDEIGSDREPPREQVAMEDQREEVGIGEPSHDSGELSLSFAEENGGQDARKKKSRSEGKLEGLDLGGGDEETPVEVLTPEDSLVAETDAGETMLESRLANRMGSPFLSLAAGVRDREEWKNVCSESKPEEEKQSCGDRSVATTAPVGGTVAEVPSPRVAGEQIFSLVVVELCERNWEAKEAGADGVSGKLGFWTESIGQAQSLIFTPPQFTHNRGVLQEKTEMGQKKEGISFNSKAGGLDKTMDPPNTLLVAENKAFDPGDSFSAFGIARSSCFKLWDPGGRLLLIVSSYIFTLRTR